MQREHINGYKKRFLQNHVVFNEYLDYIKRTNFDRSYEAYLKWMEDKHPEHPTYTPSTYKDVLLKNGVKDHTRNPDLIKQLYQKYLDNDPFPPSYARFCIYCKNNNLKPFSQGTWRKYFKQPTLEEAVHV